MIKEGSKVLVDIANKVGEHEWVKGVILGEGYHNTWTIELSNGQMITLPEKDRLGDTLIKEDK